MNSKGIEPNGRITVDSPLICQIKNNNTISKGEPFKEIGYFDHGAVLERVNIEFPQIKETKTEFEIKYPVELSTIVSTSTIGPGEESPIVFKITNISSKDIGSNTDEGRVLRVKVNVSVEEDIPHGKVKTALDRNDFYIISEEGNIIESDTYFLDINNLSANSSCTQCFTVKFKEGVESYSFVFLTITLELGDINDIKSFKPIQQRTIDVQIAEAYSPNSNSNTLLIVNNKTSKVEVQEWKELVELVTKKPLSIYNISLYGGLDPHKIRESDGKCLIDDFAGGMMILLNNQCNDNDSEELKTPYHDLCGIYPLELIKQYAIRLLIVDFNVAQYKRLQTPLSKYIDKTELELNYESPEDFFKSGIDRISYYILQARNYNRTDKTIIEYKNKDNESLFVSKSKLVTAYSKNDCEVACELWKKRHVFYKKKYGTLNSKERILHWYDSSSDKSPKGFIDLNIPFSIEIPKDKKEDDDWKFTITSKSKQYEFKTSKEEDFIKWKDALENIQNSLEEDSNQTSKPFIWSPLQSNDNEPTIVDDVFFGWIKKPGKLRDTKLFMVLRLHDKTISIYSENQLWKPIETISTLNIKMVKGWVDLEKEPMGNIVSKLIV